MNEDEELLAIFRAEVEGQLETLSELLSSPPERWRIDELIRLAHNVKGASRLTATTAMMEVAHALEDLFEALRRGESPEEHALLARRGAKLLERTLTTSDDATQSAISLYQIEVATALGAGAVETPSSVPAPANRPDSVPSIAPAAITSADQVADIASTPIAEPAGTLRIRVDRLQHLMGLSSELFASLHRAEHQQSLAVELAAGMERVRRAAKSNGRNPELDRVLALSRELVEAFGDGGHRQRQLSDELRDALRALRMVPMETLRGALRKVVRDAKDALSREVELTFEGSETELDRAVIESLRDPLTHVVRNAVAHGIEAPQQRQSAGKPRIGRIVVRAEPAGAWVDITVIDDGRGLDLGMLRAKALGLELGEGRTPASLSDEELVELVFRPGFSTASAVTEVAGRGFGMDIVRSRLDEIGGSVSIEGTKGRGTTVRMRVPLTRLTSRVLVVSVAGQAMAIPVPSIDRAVLVTRGMRRVVDGHEVVPIADALVPVASMSALLGLDVTDSASASAIVIVDGARRLALLVDDVLGESELTVQGLGSHVGNIPCIAGASVTDAGEILLVLDPRELVRRASKAADVGTGPVQRGAVVDRRHRILVVDDSVTSRTLERNILASSGYDVVTAINGEAAFELLQSENVDLVVSDVEMPKMNGIELVRAIRASTIHHHLPLILVTSRGSEADRRLGAESGANAYVVKGEFDQDELLRAVRRLL